MIHTGAYYQTDYKPIMSLSQWFLEISYICLYLYTYTYVYMNMKYCMPSKVYYENAYFVVNFANWKFSCSYVLIYKPFIEYYWLLLKFILKFSKQLNLNCQLYDNQCKEC